MNIYDKLINKKTKLSLVGLGYVGLPIAVSFAKKIDVIGFDLNSEKIKLYKNGIDPTNEVGNSAIAETSIYFTSDEKDLSNADFHIVAVPTPVNKDHTPDLSPVKSACEIVGRNLNKGAIVVFESTVYPGVTEDVCVPILEKESGLKCGIDFKVGYSPERINPGDKEHRLETIVKIVSGMDQESLEQIEKVYSLVIKAGLYKAPNIKVAEAAKVIENSQRDINIAFMNELSIIFNQLGIDTLEVIKAASTKWNFLRFYPGLVGGHCIGVDPYYLTYKAEEIGYHSQIILSGRKINDEMGKYVAQNVIKLLCKLNKPIKDCKVVVFGLTFKENCPDTRNTKVIDIIEELKLYGITPLVVDPVAAKEETKRIYNIDLIDLEKIENVDAIIIATAHQEFLDIDLAKYKKMFGREQNILVDVKGILNKEKCIDNNITYWRL